MVLRILAGILCVACLVSCNRPDYATLKQENDSLRAEITERQHILAVLAEAKQLLDSIDQNRNKTVGDEHIVQRLAEVNEYVKSSEANLVSMEKDLTQSKWEANSYLMMLDALKGELGIRVDEVTILEDSMTDFHSENEALVFHLSQKEQMILQLREDIVKKHQQLNDLEGEVVSMETKLNLSEAEKTFARAQEVELSGRKMLLAPQKKRETLKEALELYKKAFGLGKKEAGENISLLEDDIEG